jgi:hypothetical protein
LYILKVESHLGGQIAVTVTGDDLLTHIDKLDTGYLVVELVVLGHLKSLFRVYVNIRK